MPAPTNDDGIIYGTPSSDVLEGLSGNDALVGYAGDDRLIGGGGDDQLWGGVGADSLDGGQGRDMAVYLASKAGVTVDLRLAGPQESGGEAAGDRLVSIENVTGSAHDDILIGNEDDNTLRGGGGADMLDGGDGLRDRASYAFSPASVDVDLARSGAQAGGDAQGDVLANMEDLTGSGHDDRLAGDAHDNVINGGTGADLIDGRGGADTAEYTGSPTGIDVDLTRMAPQIGGYAQGDILVSMENLYGSAHDDHIIGDSGVNRLSGAAGNDIIMGGGGEGYDRINAGAGDDEVVLNGVGRAEGGEGFDHLILDFRAAETVTGPAPGGGTEELGFDVSFNPRTGEISLAKMTTGIVGEAAGFEQLSIEGSTGSDRLVGTPNADVLHGHEGNDTIISGGGADELDGGAGFDRLQVSYAAETEDLTIDAGSGILPGGATVRGFEQITVISGAGNDTVHGFDGDSGLGYLPGVTLTGDYFMLGAGDDLAFGGAGGDRLDGDEGNDRLHGESGNDHFYGGNGSDLLWGGEGADTFNYVGGETGVDRIEDFEDGIDHLRFLDGITRSFEQVLAAAHETSEGVVIDRGESSILLVNIAITDLDAGDFLFGY
ncbi:hypothetical protein ABLE91_20655 [Aquabacter sp. CN5-332]|uniref:hypothetical protein n=1 Tax=Aquabacter sp. CN5-332 TaxID=3156608 RepID=UPI0032B34B3E